MNIEQARAVARSFSMGHGGFQSWGMTFTVQEIPSIYVTDIDIHLAVTANVMGRDGKELPGPLRMDERISTAMLHVMDEKAFKAHIYSRIRMLILHEMDESIMVNGVREYDPHKGDLF